MTTPSPFGKRRSFRLTAFDYDTPGAYFVTIVANGRRLIFGDVSGDDVTLHPVGTIVDDEWRKTPALRPQVELDEFVVMPNHFHAIVWLGQKDKSAGKTPALSQVMAGFKSAVARRAKREGLVAEVWQRGFFERVIRNERELDAIREYIVGNPRLWSEDRENPERTTTPDDEPWMQ